MADRDTRLVTQEVSSTPTPAARTREESSVLFSLRELMDLENARVSEEEQRAEAARLQQQRAKMEAEFRIAAADEARKKADAERRALEEASRREEQARLEAIRLGTIERARIDAVEKARRDALQLEHEHQKQLVKTRGQHERSSLKRALVGVIAAAFVFGGSGVAYYVGVVRPQSEAQKVELARKTEQLEAAARNKKAETDALATRTSELERDIEALRATPTVTAVVAPPTPAPTVRPRLLPTVVPTVVPTVPKAPCNPLDPVEERLDCKK